MLLLLLLLGLLVAHLVLKASQFARVYLPSCRGQLTLELGL